MLEAKEVAYSYVKGRPILKSVSALVEPGSFLAILGVNGCGKSALMACLDDALKPDSGIELLDREGIARRRSPSSPSIAMPTASRCTMLCSSAESRICKALRPKRIMRS